MSRKITIYLRAMLVLIIACVATIAILVGGGCDAGTVRGALTGSVFLIFFAGLLLPAVMEL